MPPKPYFYIMLKGKRNKIHQTQSEMNSLLSNGNIRSKLNYIRHHAPKQDPQCPFNHESISNWGVHILSMYYHNSKSNVLKMYSPFPTLNSSSQMILNKQPDGYDSVSLSGKINGPAKERLMFYSLRSNIQIIAYILRNISILKQKMIQYQSLSSSNKVFFLTMISNLILTAISWEK